MSKSPKKLKAKPSVLERTKQFEKGSNKSDSNVESDSNDEDSMDFAALVRVSVSLMIIALCWILW